MTQTDPAGVPQESPQPNETPASAQPAVAQPQVEATEQPVIDGFDYDKIFARYKKDPKELAKAKYEQDKVITKLTQELAAFKKTPESKKETEAKLESKGPSFNFVEQLDSAYSEVFNLGKLSEETVSNFGFKDPSDAALFSEALGEIVTRRTKDAQKHVETDVKILQQYATQEGVYTDEELAVIQAALRLKNYSILRDVERKYKSSQKTTVEHGSLPSTNTGSDSYSSPDEYFKDKKDSRYGWDREYTKAVDAKHARSDSANWAMQMWLGQKK